MPIICKEPRLYARARSIKKALSGTTKVLPALTPICCYEQSISIELKNTYLYNSDVRAATSQAIC